MKASAQRRPSAAFATGIVGVMLFATVFTNVEIAKASVRPSCLGVSATIWIDDDTGHIMNGDVDTLVTYTGVLMGTSNDDVIVGTGGDDDITTNGGRDKVCSGNGDDDITGTGDDPQTIAVGDGNNTITLNNGDNLVTGGGGDNMVLLGNGANFVAFGDGNNEIDASNGNNTVYLGAGHDRIRVGDGTNTIGAGGGNDLIFAGNGNNSIDGGDGFDICDAGAGTNTITNCEDDGSMGVITITQAPTSSGTYDFSGDLGAFSLAGGNSEGFLLSAGTYAVTQATLTGSTLTNVSCDPSTGTTVNVSNRSAEITLQQGTSVVCTFSNTDPGSSSSSVSSGTGSSVSSSSSSSSGTGSTVSSSSSSSSSVSSSPVSSGSDQGGGSTANTAPPNTVGGSRGHDFHVVAASLDAMTGNGFFASGEGIPPAAFGGSEGVQPFWCSVQRLMDRFGQKSQNTSSRLLSPMVAEYLSNLTGLDAAAIEENIMNPNACPTTEQPQAAKIEPIPVPVALDGYPLSSNETWNKCVRGTATLADVKVNPDSYTTRSGKTIHRDCGWYRYSFSNNWRYPDDAFLTLTINEVGPGQKPSIGLSGGIYALVPVTEDVATSDESCTSGICQ